MNSKSIYTAGKYLLLTLLIFTGFACGDDEETEDTSIPVLVSQNIADGDVVGPDGYIELVFSKAMRQAPETEIYFNGRAVRISINYEKVRYSYADMENEECTFEIPAGALTDMQGRAYNQDFFLNFTAKSDISAEGEDVFDAVVDASGRGDFTTVQAAINAAPANSTRPYLIFVTAGTYNECIRITNAKPFIHLIGESRERVKIQYAVNRVRESDNTTTWPYSIHNPESPARQAGYSENQESVVLIEASDFYAENITFINLFGALSSRYDGGLGRDGQAEVMMNRQDRFALNNCRLVSWQDTWWSRPYSNTAINRAYVSNSWIEGRTDYVWGSGTLLIENSTFYNAGNGSLITAVGDNGVFAMRDCIVDGESGITPTSFGRPYRAGMTNVWINTQLKMDIVPSHWTAAWGNTPGLYGEYNTTDKNGMLISTEPKTVSDGNYSFQTAVLDASQADSYTYERLIATGDWSPKQFMEAPESPNPTKEGNVLSWNAVSGAVGYLIFMNNAYMAHTTATSVTLTNTDDSVIYTVRAVNRYGSLSHE